MIYIFQDCVKCLSEFGCNPFYEKEALEAISLIRKCAKYVSEHKDRFLSQDILSAAAPDSNNSSTASNLDGVKMDRVWFRGWFPVLFELSCIINSSKLDIRTRSLTILFDIVKNHGDTFEPDWWRQLFGVLFRIFDLVKVSFCDLDFFYFQFDIILQMVKHNKISDIGALIGVGGDPEVATDKSIS